MRVYQGLVKSGLVVSKKEALALVKAERVRVNSVNVNSLDYFYDNKRDVLFVDDKIIKNIKEKIYLLFNKPRGTETTKENILKFIDLPSNIKQTIFPVGRLDKDSEGLLILTNDGALGDSILNPDQHVEKTYIIKTKYELSDPDIKKLMTGVDIELEENGKKETYSTLPCKIKKINDLMYEFKIIEGKKRQIRRMLESINNEVIDLKRIAIGNLLLGEMKLGESKNIESEKLKDSIGL